MISNTNVIQGVAYLSLRGYHHRSTKARATDLHVVPKSSSVHIIKCSERRELVADFCHFRDGYTELCPLLAASLIGLMLTVPGMQIDQ